MFINKSFLNKICQKLTFSPTHNTHTNLDITLKKYITNKNLSL